MKIKRGQYKQLKQISNDPQTKEMPGQYGSLLNPTLLLTEE